MELAEDVWESLLPDLLLDIFRRLKTTAVIRCAATCKPWRRAIISNASSLHPRPDSFVPSLLLGFFPGNKIGNSCAALFRTPPAPSQPVLPEPNPRGCCTFFPPAASGITGGDLLSSRDGFLLIKRRCDLDPICLWNPVTGTCTFLPMPSITCGTYVLLSDYDDLPGACSSTKKPAEVQILAVQEINVANDFGGGGGCRTSFGYQLFSGGAWAPVEWSKELPSTICMHLQRGAEVVCRSGSGATVHWLAWWYTFGLDIDECAIALDVGTGRTWTTELPATFERMAPSRHSLNLATTRDGRLSVISLLDKEQIQVWVLGDGDEWLLRRVVCLRELMLDVQNIKDVVVWAFCPRSGCVLFHMERQQFLVDLDTGSSRQIQSSFPNWRARPYPYEMDWSEFWNMCLSKLKHF